VATSFEKRGKIMREEIGKTSDEISLQLDELDREILVMKDTLDTVQVEKHKKEREVFELSEAVRTAKFNLAKKRLEKEMLQRAYWRSKE